MPAKRRHASPHEDIAKAAFLKNSAVSTIDIDKQPPAFSFERMEDGSGHSFNCCIDEDRLALGKRIFMLSREPWLKITLASREGLGAEKISKDSVRKSVPSAVTDDVSYFYSLHYLGKKRFLGYKVGQIFYVLWIDHNFGVYNHGP